ncbi:NAD(P)H-dependent flavin oxidoreductase [Geodermatophilus sp. SYSU D00710]
MRTRFTELGGCTVPVQQAPMGPVSPPDLAVAVADAGGVGTVTALGTPPEALLRRLDGMRERTQGALAVNVLTTDVDDDLLADLARRVRLVDFFWRDPSPRLVEVAHDAGALVNWQFGSLAEARAAVDAGCDLITVQGVEAGGHVRGREPLLPLLRAVLDAVDVPVLAAGGIADGRALAEVIAAGADGARIGTRFIATTESGAHPAYKQAVVDATGDYTEITGAFATACPLYATSARARVLSSAVERRAELDDDVIARVSSGRAPVWCRSGLPPVAGAVGHVDAMYAGAASAR